MDIDEYQATTLQTAVYPDKGEGTQTAITYCALGLVGEAGEVAEVVKKLHRGDFDRERTMDECKIPAHQTREFQRRAASELGDVFWYWCRLCHELGVPAHSIIEDNLEKLADRQMRGVIQGSGNDR